MSTERFGMMLHENLLARVRGIMAERDQRLAAIQTRTGAEAYVKQVRRCVKKAFGPLPPRTPLNTRVTKVTRVDDYTIENIIYESRPGYWVTANLYVPSVVPRGGKYPAVLMLCGHSGGGKQFELYQTATVALVKKGFLTLIVDPLEQGERHQFEHMPEKKRPGLCEAHCLMANQQALLGDFFGSWRAWDAIRGLDVLLERPEADTTRVGVTGNSGGGTLTTYVAALDPRPTMVAPSCYICSYAANLQNELPSDGEQNPPGIIGMGLDQADLLLAYAPRPTLILGQRDDMFDVRYTRKAGGEVAKIHRLLGSNRSAEFFAGPCGHGFSIENREAMVQFFMKHAGLKGDHREAPFKGHPDALLHATPGGSVVKAGSRRLQDLAREEAAFYRRERGKPSAETVRREAARLLGVKKPDGPPHHRMLRGGCGEVGPLKVFRQFGLETEAGILAVVSDLTPGDGIMYPAPGNATAFIGNESGLQDVRMSPSLRKLVKKGDPFFVIDPRGIGESKPHTCGSESFMIAYGADYLYAATGEMLGESLLGRRVFDVMRSLDFLYAQGAKRIRLTGRGVGAVTAAFAGLLHPARPDVVLLDYLPSYDFLMAADIARWPLSSLLRGVLRHFDLPDVHRALGKRLTLGKPWDAVLTKRPVL